MGHAKAAGWMAAIKGRLLCPFLGCWLAEGRAGSGYLLPPTPPPPPTTAPAPPRSLQLLAYPLNTMDGMPWEEQTVMEPLAEALNALAGLSTNAALEMAITALSVAWCACCLALVGLCMAHFYKERHAGALPVKVCDSMGPAMLPRSPLGEGGGGGRGRVGCLWSFLRNLAVWFFLPFEILGAAAMGH